MSSNLVVLVNQILQPVLFHLVNQVVQQDLKILADLVLLFHLFLQKVLVILFLQEGLVIQLGLETLAPQVDQKVLVDLVSHQDLFDHFHLVGQVIQPDQVLLVYLRNLSNLVLLLFQVHLVVLLIHFHHQDLMAQ